MTDYAGAPPPVRTAYHSTQTHRIVGAAVCGPSHSARGAPCDDAFAFDTRGELAVAVICDGAGSAMRGGEGARLMAHRLSEELIELVSVEPLRLSETIAPLRAIIETAIGRIREELLLRAEDGGHAPKDFRTTVVGVAAIRDAGVFFHIGDGAGLALSPRDEGITSLIAVSEAQNGEYANETVFVTDADWLDTLRVTPFIGAGWVALMSDGVSPFALDKSQIEPAQGFFTPLLSFLAEQPDGAIAARALGKMLDRPDARKASGDDKALVLIAPFRNAADENTPCADATATNGTQAVGSECDGGGETRRRDVE